MSKVTAKHKRPREGVNQNFNERLNLIELQPVPLDELQFLFWLYDHYNGHGETSLRIAAIYSYGYIQGKRAERRTSINGKDYQN